MKSTRHRWAAMAVLLAAAACSSDTAGPADINPDAVRPARGFLVNGPKGYGFTGAGGDMASVSLEGTHFKRCTDNDDGWAEARLTLSAKMVDEMWDVLDQGGSVTVQVMTYHRMQGKGDLSYSEQIAISGPAISGSLSNQEQMSSPGYPSHTETLIHEHSITRNDMGGVIAGGTITVSATASAQGSLGIECGRIVGGHAYWKMRGVVMRLNP